jgi:PTS system trehalose-specific IIC component
MSKIKQADIDRLIELVGGRDNIATVSHCITRLRFVLNQPANARPKEIEQLPMVKGCFTNAGQFQVVIGTEVGDYYKRCWRLPDKPAPTKSRRKSGAAEYEMA